MFKIKITEADRLCSLLVRERDQWKCVKCGRKHEKSNNTCDASHYWGRGFKSVRFDFENIDTLCKLPCHTGRHQTSLGWEYQKQIKGYNGALEDGAYTSFKKIQLGEKAFNLLMIRAHTPEKQDEKTLRTVFKLELEIIENEKKKNIIGAK